MIYRLELSATLLAAMALLAGVSTVSADWLVTQDGHRVETRGAWRVEGNVVLFEPPTGGLRSLRLTEVSLEASRQATEEARQVVESESQDSTPRRESVFRLTDADVGHVADDAGAGEEPAPALEDGSEPTPAAARSLVVTDWSDDTDPDGDGLVIIGTLRNASRNTSGNIRLVVRLYDVDGAFITSAVGRLSKVALPPGETAHFRAEIPGVFTYSAVRFETESLDFQATAPLVEDAVGDDDFDG